MKRPCDRQHRNARARFRVRPGVDLASTIVHQFVIGLVSGIIDEPVPNLLVPRSLTCS
jgi:hypothetical protein